MIDRLLHGSVVDFIQLHWRGAAFPSFIVADSERIVSFLGVGVLMMLMGYFVPLPPRDGGDVTPEQAS